MLSKNKVISSSICNWMLILKSLHLCLMIAMKCQSESFTSSKIEVSVSPWMTVTIGTQ